MISFGGHNLDSNCLANFSCPPISGGGNGGECES